MIYTFYKYQGAGNDFVIIDNQNEQFPRQNFKQIKHICDRKFGVGADGFMLLETSQQADFKMTYHNADGKLGSMCGNGGRCIVAFAKFIGLIDNSTTFEASNSIYQATIENNEVRLKMNDLTTRDIQVYPDHVFLNTGSPHHVALVDDLDNFPVYTQGQKIRHGAPYFEEGTNVNFIEQLNNNTLKIRTFERGVENETLACGTGVTAAAIASHFTKKIEDNHIFVKAIGGNLSVSFELDQNHYKNIILSGPATYVFKGEIEI